MSVAGIGKGNKMYGYYEREISKADYDAIKNKEKSVYDFFSVAEKAGYGALAYEPKEKDGKYIIPFNMSDSCD